jgi:hypothetical protein
MNMSIAYNKFLEQFNSSGSQKAQGYDASHFEGLTEEEQESVFSHLQQELIAPGTIGWLFHLNPKKTKMVLIDYLSDEKNTAGLHRVLISLYHFTGNTHYLDEFESRFSKFYDWEKSDAINLFKAYAQPDERKMNFLKNNSLRG